MAVPKDDETKSRKKPPNNHAPKGSAIAVDPIKSPRALATIARLLADRPRDHALFVLGIHSALRAGDLLALTVGRVKAILADPDDGDVVRESKEHKLRRICANKAVRTAVERLLASRPWQDGDLLFQGKRGPLTTSWLRRMVIGWCEAVNLPGHYGSHTLRKTFGYQMRVNHNVDIPTLMAVYNHATQKQTLDYLCIQPDEIRSVYAIELV
ncbi:tyrosine-type recombinase/integrase [Solidesulfovibrio magneticus]|uniref:tyrosine-type recombinase/integrase n=1 Tax=Solidesulfovibrio magneticus TaxID=184917 RepID=UPI0002ECF28C|nr:tyrosine-type recombinase/integrase [Solidesulfovibrio magneticus]